MFLKYLRISLLILLCVAAAPLQRTGPPAPSYSDGSNRRKGPCGKLSTEVGVDVAGLHKIVKEIVSDFDEDTVGEDNKHRKASSDENVAPQKKKVSGGEDKEPGDARRGDPKASTDNVPAKDDKKTLAGGTSSGEGDPATEGKTKPSTEDGGPTSGTSPLNGEGKPPKTAKEDPASATEPAETGGKKPTTTGDLPTGATEPNIPSTPKENPPETGEEKSTFVPDGEAPVENDLPPAGVVGIVIAGVALLAAACVAWSRRSVDHPQAYETVQGEEIDADGWNNGWDDGWEEAAGTKA